MYNVRVFRLLSWIVVAPVLYKCGSILEVVFSASYWLLSLPLSTNVAGNSPKGMAALEPCSLLAEASQIPSPMGRQRISQGKKDSYLYA